MRDMEPLAPTRSRAPDGLLPPREVGARVDTRGFVARRVVAKRVFRRAFRPELPDVTRGERPAQSAPGARASAVRALPPKGGRPARPRSRSDAQAGRDAGGLPGRPRTDARADQPDARPA